MESWLNGVLAKIEPVSKELLEAAQKRLDNLTKPKGSLGRLEELGKRFVAIRGDLEERVRGKIVFVFAGDHGVTEEGVSAFPKEVTQQMVLNFLNGGAGISVISRFAGADVKVVDIGVGADLRHLEPKGLVVRKVGFGTNNIAKGPAMSREQAIEAIKVGYDLVKEAFKKGYNLFAVGEMGIGNTTPSSAIYAVITRKKVEEVTGKGTGIDDEALKKKIEVVKRAIEVNKPDPQDPVDVLSKVGGFEIGGMTGVMLAGAALKVPVVVDGFISTASALLAVSLKPEVKDYLIFAHKSQAFGHQAVLEYLGVEPLLDLGLRLGEGTGAVIGMWLTQLGEKILHEMATFEDAAVARGEEV
ncbi:nicotinate-nucleotide--dimethylbenzimidazole phosphoribosyltransferase [Thermosulfidibacter takaii ABI70S6]|uniref:Nicotinate-nucleotide--dimethylbenzimidazole phosphoribosyltransferase n=1 Tax=Thermosulfidibacter takaii (strain DSM 17441 / JCM 13301 / NBRC 103674 / ABI70S6) TaxID=1298851 RepID=A0A0S3QTS3_THET7|nr:nicotinate-nucleotide--dimethylbenzimidazole phosphoribosyltransferase [Thermosulfidibacter takaii]BAT71739.1 nicotinate-nucleotide--dimethylbenzimidazole phosphoribosyltransferase [Thermosulfidibacter takaii ABI70S6]